MPPSPLLSARSTKEMYFRVTTTMIDQKISDRMPVTLATVGVRWVWALKHSFSVYSGLVPISP